ncbi:MAG: hypothetical protein DRJ42_25725 [Deltaproteobacteria bacterium]|nr:MAG: hypothetical protein DRJ42_25725 [Deltaproteobacteria bacterium]
MSRSSLLAAAIMLFGLVAFMVLVSGGAHLSLGAPTGEPQLLAATGPTEATVVIEAGIWIPHDGSPDGPSLVSVPSR